MTLALRSFIETWDADPLILPVTFKFPSIVLFPLISTFFSISILPVLNILKWVTSDVPNITSLESNTSTNALPSGVFLRSCPGAAVFPRPSHSGFPSDLR